MGQCWRERTKRKECEHSNCCYNAFAQAVFEYWKFANSEQWKAILKREIEKEVVGRGNAEAETKQS